MVEALIEDRTDFEGLASKHVCRFKGNRPQYYREWKMNRNDTF
jgi:hypothetical protein